MAKLYTKDGWVNWDYIEDQGAVFNMIVGARGTGKTYGLMKKKVMEQKPFIYLRRLKTQLDQCAKGDGNPFKKLNSDLGMTITPYSAGSNVIFTDGNRTGNIIAIGMALSVVANMRGMDFSDVDTIIYDEAVGNTGEREVKDEFTVFLNFYETVNRNRELEGKAPVKVYLLGNANKLSNPYFTGWHFMKTAIKMIRGGQMVWRSPDGNRMMILLLHSPISEKKRETALYKNANDGFLEMALDNAFRTDETVIRSEPLREYNHMVSIGDIGIYRHKSERRFYVSSKTQQPFYHDYGIELKLFQQDYALLRICYMVSRTVVFESYENEIIFRELFNLNN